MRKPYSVVPVEHSHNDDLSHDKGVENSVTPANSDQDLDLVKVASKWKRRDQGTPAWWRNHLMGMFR